jgi:hypothetical protein
VLTEPRSKADKEAGRLSATAETYMLALIGEYLTGLPADDYQSPAMKWGTEWEAEARDVYAEMMDCDVDTTGFVHHATIPRVGASPDGLIGTDGLVEIKCPNTATHIDTLLNGTIKPEYYWQMMAGIACTGRSWWHFVSYDPRMPAQHQIYISTIKRDEDAISLMFIEVVKFLVELDELILKIYKQL